MIELLSKSELEQFYSLEKLVIKYQKFNEIIHDMIRLLPDEYANKTLEEIFKKYGYFHIDDKADLSLTLREYLCKVSPGSNVQFLKEFHDTFVNLENQVIEKYNLNNFHNQTD